MLLEQEQWYLGYEQILRDCRRDNSNNNGSRSALILCNADVDAMSSARILSFMLRSDGIQYQLFPCSCYSDLKLQLSNIVRGGGIDDVCSIVLLNFGATYNLTRLFGSQLLQDGSVRLYVMDCHKPIHLANVYSSNKINVFSNEGIDNMEEMPSDGDNLSGEEESSSSSSSSESDSDDDDSDEDGSRNGNDDEIEANFDDIINESDLKKNAPPKEKISAQSDDASYDGEDEKEIDTEYNDYEENHREEQGKNGAGEEIIDGEDHSTRSSKRLKVNDDETNESNQNEGGNDDHEESNSQNNDDKRKVDADEILISPEEMHRRRLERLREYYNDGTFFATPAAFVAYVIAKQLRYGEKGDLLWLACVGVTDAYLHSRLDLAGYAMMAKELSDTCSKLFPNNRYEKALSTVYAEDLVGRHNSYSGRYDDVNRSKTKIALSENGRIFFEKDFRFFMLRHSSLLDSMKYSDYVWTRLKVYTKKGEQQLLEMLAKMGYPLDECRQPFPFMKPILRRRLKEKLAMHAQEYNLDHLEFTSFARITGYQSMLSASDTSYAVTALLEYENGSGTLNNISDETRTRIESFNNAYDALGSNSTEPMDGLLNGMKSEGYDSSNLVNGGNLSSNVGIGAGLRHAMTLQKCIFQTAMGLLQRGAITTLRHFRYAHVTSSTTSEGEIIGTDKIHSSGRDSEIEKKDHVFSKPLALTRLAYFLMDMNRENGKWIGVKSRPLVLIADKLRSNSCLIIGFQYPERAGDTPRNTFGRYFKQTSESMKGTFKFDSFDSNVVEVAAENVQRFLEQLNYLLESL